MTARKAFTLIELMIVVAIIGILAAIALPKFSALVAKSKEGATKGALSSLRTALSVYYASSEGMYPTDDLSVLMVNGKYISAIPTVKLPDAPHPNSSLVTTAASEAALITEAGGWAYINAVNTHSWGKIAVNCSHPDSGGTVWSTY
jgi:prepilin-type N-terminal cleavage/methylation domain-containing protein